MKLLYYVMRRKYAASARRYQTPPDQWGLLQGILKANQTSLYGRQHHFRAIRSWADYQQLPIVTYDDLADRIDRISQGEANVLTTEPVRLLEPTSGSSGRVKWIPYTKTLQEQFRLGVEAWLYDIYASYAGLNGGRSYWMITPPQPRTFDTAVPVGFDDDAAYLGSLGQKVMNRLMVRPELRVDMSTESFYRATLRALLAEPDLRLISLWNPSLLLGLIDYLRQEPKACLAGLAGDRRRQLEQAIERSDWRSLWPRLAFISAWADASAKLPAKRLQQLFPGVAFQPKGLLSTECLASFPTRQSLLAGGMIPAYHSTVMEFRRGDEVCLLDQIEPEKDYELIITTGGGLYRYATGDLVRVSGRWRDLPLLRFLGRLETVDMAGEKMTAGFVETALSDVAGFCLLTPLDRGYVLYTDQAITPAQVEQRLRTNFHYRLARQLGQLDAVKVWRIRGDAGTQYLTNCRRHGQKLGDIKPVRFSARRDFSFEGDYHD